MRVRGPLQSPMAKPDHGLGPSPSKSNGQFTKLSMRSVLAFDAFGIFCWTTGNDAATV
jgi:hypothetical protein